MAEEGRKTLLHDRIKVFTITAAPGRAPSACTAASQS
jgi:hypothetical protein